MRVWGIERWLIPKWLLLALEAKPRPGRSQYDHAAIPETTLIGRGERDSTLPIGAPRRRWPGAANERGGSWLIRRVAPVRTDQTHTQKTGSFHKGGRFHHSLNHHPGDQIQMMGRRVQLSEPSAGRGNLFLYRPVPNSCPKATARDWIRKGPDRGRIGLFATGTSVPRSAGA